MSAEDYIKEAEAESQGGLIGGLIALLIMGSCANMPKYPNQDKSPDKIPVKIEHRESIATNQIHKVTYHCLIHTQ